MRVVLASERPQIQDLLVNLVEQEPGVVVVGRADNAHRTLDLVKNLHPDVAIIDSDLPYSVGIDGLALTRMSGLDTAQAIRQAAPGIHVLLINSLNIHVGCQPGEGNVCQPSFSTGEVGSDAVVKLEELWNRSTAEEAPLFAGVEVKPMLEAAQAYGGVTTRGVFSIAGGAFLIGTVWLAPFGAVLLLAGMGMLGAGLVRKALGKLSRKHEVN